MANELRNSDLGVFEPTDDFFGDFGKNFFNSIASNQMKLTLLKIKIIT
ncbi:hypothetical protein [Apilactobacillus micheneri]|nr:hypothetical protein [Apilactobacillus micheneri]